MTHDILTFLGTIFIGSAALVGIAVFLGRALLSHLLSKDIEQHKAQLQTDHAIALERLRSDLRLAAFEHETRFAKLHEKRAEVIAGLYQRLTAAETAMTRFLTGHIGTTPIEKRAKAMASAGDDLDRFVLENRIYFDEKLCERLDRFGLEIKRAFAETVILASGVVADDKEGEQYGKIFESLKSDIPELRHDLEREFRKLLGH